MADVAVSNELSIIRSSVWHNEIIQLETFEKIYFGLCRLQWERTGVSCIHPKYMFLLKLFCTVFTFVECSVACSSAGRLFRIYSCSTFTTDNGEIRVGSKYQTEKPISQLTDQEMATDRHQSMDTVVFFYPNLPLIDRCIDQLYFIAARYAQSPALPYGDRWFYFVIF